MLQVTDLSRQYGDFTAVDSVNFTINKGDIVGLLGHNGAGKTTIMKMMSGYLEPNNGSVSLDGVELETHLNQVQRDLGYLPENLPVYPEMTVADYLDYAADMKGLGANKTSEIKRAIQATELGEKLLSPIATLSRGYKQRVGVAQAILGKPKLLILDEPTNGLDPNQTQHMRQLIKEISEDATVILSTHIMQEVEAICNRVLILRAGQLAVDSTLEELRQSKHILLETSMSPELVESRLSTINEVRSITLDEKISGAHKYSYRIELTQAEALDSVCTTAADYIINKKCALYRLQPEQRDLETLFREVNEQVVDTQELNHAA